MEALIQKLYDYSHRLLHFGEKGETIYADEYLSLNQEVDRLSARLFIYIPRSQQEEALLCLVLLMSYAASYTNSFQKENKLSEILARVENLLFGKDPRWSETLPDSLIRIQLATYAYTFTYEKKLLQEVHRLITSWKDHILKSQEIELLELLQNCEANVRY